MILLQQQCRFCQYQGHLDICVHPHNPQNNEQKNKLSLHRQIVKFNSLVAQTTKWANNG